MYRDRESYDFFRYEFSTMMNNNDWPNSHRFFLGEKILCCSQQLQNPEHLSGLIKGNHWLISPFLSLSNKTIPLGSRG